MSNKQTIDGVPRELSVLIALKKQQERDILRFYDTCEDGQGYDVPKDRMKSLARLGLIRSTGFSRYEITDAGDAVIEKLRALLDAPAAPSCAIGHIEQHRSMGLAIGAAITNVVWDIPHPELQHLPDGAKVYLHPAAQPQGEPVTLPAILDTVQMDGYQSPYDAGWNAYGKKVREAGPLYANPPAPVAVEPGEPYAYEYEFATVLYIGGPGKFKKIITHEAPDQHEIDAGCIINVKPLYSAEPRKYDDTLLLFLALMRKELHANSDKGDREGWLGMTSGTALAEVRHHVLKLENALADAEAPLIKEHAADVANCAMMLADVCGVLGRA